MYFLKRIFLCFLLAGMFSISAANLSMIPHVCILKGKNGSGTGFFLDVEGQLCIVTNNHVLLEIENVEITDINGKKIPYTYAYASPDRDLAFLPLKNKLSPGEVFSVHPNPGKIVPGYKVEALGNSLGQNVVVSAKGKFLGVGPDFIEVSAPFVPGNSGGPVILSGTNLVIGVATYLHILQQPQVTTIGSRFEVEPLKPAIRRFATRIDDVNYLSFEKLTLQQMRDDYKEFSKIQKLEEEILALLQSRITPDTEKRIKDFRYTIRRYVSQRKWNSSYLKKEYQKKHQFLEELLKKIFPGDEFQFSISSEDRKNKLIKIWQRHFSHIKFKKISAGFQLCGKCRGQGSTMTLQKNKKNLSALASETCVVCNGKKKIPVYPPRQHALFSKKAIVELTSVIEQENRKISGYYLGSSATEALFKDKFYKRRRWDILYEGVFRIFRYPGNPHFSDAAETRFWFFGSKLMRVDLYFIISDEKSGIETEINFYNKYYSGDKKIAMQRLLHGNKVSHPHLSSERFHKSRDFFFCLYDKLKKEGSDSAAGGMAAKNHFSFSRYITDNDFQDPFGIYMNHRPFYECVCNYAKFDVKQYLCLSLYHTDYRMVRDLMQTRHSSITF